MTLAFKLGKKTSLKGVKDREVRNRDKASEVEVQGVRKMESEAWRIKTRL